jgi:hypothetical protein
VASLTGPGTAVHFVELFLHVVELFLLSSSFCCVPCLLPCENLRFALCLSAMCFTASASMGGPADFGGPSIAPVSSPVPSVPSVLPVVVPLLHVRVGACAGLSAARTARVREPAVGCDLMHLL